MPCRTTQARGALTCLALFSPNRITSIGAKMYESQRNVTEPNMKLFGFDFVPDDAVVTGTGNVRRGDTGTRATRCPLALGFLLPPLLFSHTQQKKKT